MGKGRCFHGHCLNIFIQTVLKMSSLKDILNITLNVFKLSDCITLRLSFCAFCLIPGAQNHLLLFSCKIQTAPEHFRPAQRLQIERAWESNIKLGSGEPKDK